MRTYRANEQSRRARDEAAAAASWLSAVRSKRTDASTPEVRALQIDDRWLGKAKEDGMTPGETFELLVDRFADEFRDGDRIRAAELPGYRLP